jgi:hypothetical protein
MVIRAGLALCAALGFVVGAGASGVGAQPADVHDPDYDLAIRGGTLYTGGFEMAGAGDLALRGDRIVAVGSAPGRARREIDARGKVVAPGFIDLHNHTDMGFSFVDWLPLPAAAREIRNFLTQGVTTIVTGNCGSGPATPEAVAAWLARADETPFGTNVVHLVPHGQLRLDVMGARQADRADPRPSATELAEMEAILRPRSARGRGVSPPASSTTPARAPRRTSSWSSRAWCTNTETCMPRTRATKAPIPSRRSRPTPRPSRSASGRG